MRTTFAMVATVAALCSGAAWGEEQGGAAALAAKSCAGDRDCDDADPKTHDFCQRLLNGQEQAEARCVHAPIRNECDGNDDCDDENPATRDTCLRGVGEHGEPEARCRHEAAPEGCRVNPDCDDANPATRDYCQHIVDGAGSAARCVHDPIDSGCRSDRECDDADPCTRDRCVRGVNANGDPESTCNHIATGECEKRAMTDQISDQR